MRAGNGDAIGMESSEMSLGDIFDLSFLSDSETTPVDGSGTGVATAQGVTDSSSLASQLQSYLASFYGSSPLPDSTEQQLTTITPNELWRGSTPTYVPPSSFDLPVPSPTSGNDLAAGTNYSAANTHPVSQDNEPSANTIPSSPPMSGDSAPGPPADDYSASPSVDVSIKTEPDLEDEDGRPMRSLPARASKSRRRIPLDAPIQPRNYNGPSRTAAKPLPKGFEKALPVAQAAGVKRKLEAEEEEEDEEEEDEDMAELARTIKDKVALKRAKNTLAARKSRARKAAYTDELEKSISERDQQIADLERQIRERDVEIRLLKELRYPDGM